MKKYIIPVFVILILSVIISSFTFQVQALGLDALDNPDAYVQENGDNSQLVSIGNVIVWVVRTIGTAISVLILSILGIKYIMGSVEEKAEYKQTMWPYIIGAFLIFAGSSLTGIIYDMFQ